jgi:hypothetical protein
MLHGECAPVGFATLPSTRVHVDSRPPISLACVERLIAMLNRIWACFDCRLAWRHPTWKWAAVVYPESIGDVGLGRVRCAKCRELCVNLGPAIKLPPKRDEKAWARLRAQLGKRRAAILREMDRRRVRRRHELEQRVRDLKARPKNEACERMIRELKKQLEEA